MRFRERIAEPGVFPYRVLMLFVLLVYSQLPRVYPSLEEYRIVYVVGGIAVISFVLERITARKGFDFVRPQSPLILGFLAASFASIFGAVWMRHALDNTLDLAKMVALYFLIVNCIRTPRQLRSLIWLMVLGGLFPAVGGIVHWLEGSVRENRAGWEGIFANPNELAYSLVILIPLAAYLMTHASRLKVVLLWLIVATYIVAIYLTFSRGGMLGLMAMLAILGWRSRRRAVRALVLLLATATLVFIVQGWSRAEGFTRLGDDADVQSRLTTIWYGFQMFADHPLTGVGMGCSGVAWPLYAPPDITSKWLVIHNTFVQTLAETGLVGFLCFSFLLGTAWYDCRLFGREKSASVPRLLTQLPPSLETSLCGFAVCALAGGFALTWFPYLLVSLVASLKKLSDPETAVI